MHMYQEHEFELEEMQQRNLQLQKDSIELEEKSEAAIGEGSETASVPSAASSAVTSSKNAIHARDRSKSLKRMYSDAATANQVTESISTTLDNAVDKIDHKLETVENKIRDLVATFFTKLSTWHMIAVIVMFLTCYFILVTVFCILMEFVFTEIFWNSYFTNLIVCCSLCVLALFYVYVYYTQKVEYYRKTFKWHTQKSSVILAVALIIVFVVGAILTIAIACAIRFWQYNPAGIIHTAIIFTAFCVLAALTTLWIVLYFKKPAFNLDIVKAESTEPPLPRWTLFIAYPAMWAYIAAWSYCLIIYGIKFGPEKQKNWLISTFSGIAQDVFIDHPFAIVREVALLLVLYIIAALFFESTGISATGSKDVAENLKVMAAARHRLRVNRTFAKPRLMLRKKF